MHWDQAQRKPRNAESGKGVIREENHYVRSVGQHGFPSLGSIRS
jgi:hypothetical protein